MSILTRIRMIINARTNAAIDQVEDPRHTLAYAYERQRELLKKVQRGLVEVATVKHQLEQQSQKLHNQVTHLESQARQALSTGHEDLARQVLERKQACLVELERLETQQTETAEEENKLIQAEQRFAQRLDVLRTRRDALSARYTAAQAQVHVNEALSGLSSQAAELDIALDRAEDKVAKAQARATALDALLETNALSTFSSFDDVDHTISQAVSAQAVEAELNTLKEQIAQEDAPAPAV